MALDEGPRLAGYGIVVADSTLESRPSVAYCPNGNIPRRAYHQGPGGGLGIYRDDPPKPSTLVVEFNSEEQAEMCADRLRNLVRIKGTF